MTDDGIIFEGDTEFDHYRVADTIYSGRRARVLYGGNGDTAQSGVAKDGKPELLFDYNERFMELVRGIKPRNLLLIGGGAFTFPMALMEEFPPLKIDVVEIDSALLDIAKQHFNFEPNARTHVYIGDGRHYIDSVDQTYDAIIMDVFTHASIPEQFRTLEAAQSLQRHLHKKGVLAINIIGALHGRRSTELRGLVEVLQATFSNVTIFPASGGVSSWIGQNFVLVTQNSHRDLHNFFRFAPVILPKF